MTSLFERCHRRRLHPVSPDHRVATGPWFSDDDRDRVELGDHAAAALDAENFEDGLPGADAVRVYAVTNPLTAERFVAQRVSLLTRRGILR